MKDYTVGVTELRDHYNALTVLKKSVRAQVKAEYEAKMDFEIQSRIEAAEIKFANHVAAVKERDSMPVTVIQDHVLRTRTWNRWERIRDLAGIPGEFVRAEDAREAKRLETSAFIWSDDYQFLSVKRNSRGHVIDPPVEYTMEGLRKSGSRWFPQLTERSDEADAYEMTVFKGDEEFAFQKMVHAEIQRVIDAGQLDNPEHTK